MKIDTIEKKVTVYNSREYEEAVQFLRDEKEGSTNIDGWKIEYSEEEEEEQ